MQQEQAKAQLNYAIQSLPIDKSAKNGFVNAICNMLDSQQATVVKSKTSQKKIACIQPLGEDADISDVISAFNTLLYNMKTINLMSNK